MSDAVVAILAVILVVLIALVALIACSPYSAAILNACFGRNGWLACFCDLCPKQEHRYRMEDDDGGDDGDRASVGTFNSEDGRDQMQGGPHMVRHDTYGPPGSMPPLNTPSSRSAAAAVAAVEIQRRKARDKAFAEAQAKAASARSVGGGTVALVQNLIPTTPPPSDSEDDDMDGVDSPPRDAVSVATSGYRDDKSARRVPAHGPPPPTAQPPGDDGDEFGTGTQLM